MRVDDAPVGTSGFWHRGYSDFAEDTTLQACDGRCTVGTVDVDVVVKF